MLIIFIVTCTLLVIRAIQLDLEIELDRAAIFAFQETYLNLRLQLEENQQPKDPYEVPVDPADEFACESCQ